MSNDSWLIGSLTLNNKEIPVKTGYLPVGELKFYPENPRLYSIVCAGGEEPGQSFIQKKLGAMEHVKKLVHSIRANGGLTDPLIVRDGNYIVLEGNSRLAAYRLLSDNDPIKWGKVKCTLLPKDIDEGLIFALLGEYHIIGKKDWAPFEQAGYLYRRHKNHAVSPSAMAAEMGLSAKAVSQLIQVYSFMVEHEENDVTRWSYYDEYLKHRTIQVARKQHPKLDVVFVEKVRSGEVSKAVDVREKMTVIAKCGGKIVKDFVEEEGSFEKCYDRAVARGADNTWYKRLEKFREQVNDVDARDALEEMPEEQKKKCIFVMKKIRARMDDLVKILS